MDRSVLDQTRTVATPRQNRALRTREKLLAATEALVAAESAEAVTTTRIAAMTGVAVGTIYRYYPNREALLLAAYDATVDRIVSACAVRLKTIAPDVRAEAAVLQLLAAYLSAAESIPAHFALLREMRRLRPLAEDHGERVGTEILVPLLQRFGVDRRAMRPGRLAVLNALLSTLVDLYLVTEDPPARAGIRAELEAHALFALARLNG